MEGITDQYFRMIHAHLFPNSADRYYAPFISPTYDSPFVEKDVRSLLPENNYAVPNLIPQILTNQAPLLVDTAQRLADMGYTELNLNLGCPSGTVVSKKKGSGFLSVPEQLDRFFDTVFSDAAWKDTGMKLSVKSRLGMIDPNEIKGILEIYNRYPISELILHPRVRNEQYKGIPHLELLGEIINSCKISFCYNGDIFTMRDLEKLITYLPQTISINFMLGRGAVSNPAIFYELRGGHVLEKQQLYAFTHALQKEAEARLSGERHVLFRLKELWAYWIVMFDQVESYHKRLRKTQSLAEFSSITEAIFTNCPLRHAAGFRGNAKM